jgi:hypothetical protein
MAKSPRSTDEGDPLEPTLREAEAELHRRLQEACEAEASGVSTESAAEIRRLEDALVGATVAAKQAIAVREHMERRKSAEAQSASTTQATSTASATRTGDPDRSQSSAEIREFRDRSGHLWRAWPVTPAKSPSGRTSERYLGEFYKGWICFETLDGSARRRLPQVPANWSELPESELVRLLEQAITAPPRKDRGAAGERPEPPRIN